MKQFFTEDNGRLSMKRLCGLMCVVALCITMYHNSFSEAHIAPSPVLVDSVALLAFGCLGLSSVDKIWGNKGKKSKEENEG